MDRELSVRPSRAIEELYHSVLEAKRTHNWPIAWIFVNFPSWSETRTLATRGIPFLSRDGWGGRSFSRDGAIWTGRNVCCGSWSWCPIAVLTIKVEGKATSQRYEGSTWNDLRQALEKLGGWDGDFPSGRGGWSHFGMESAQIIAKKTRSWFCLKMPMDRCSVSRKNWNN